MLPEQYQLIFSRHLAPLVSGEIDQSSLIATSSKAMVTREGKKSFLLRADLNWPYQIRLTSDYELNHEDLKIAKHFVRSFRQKVEVSDKAFFPYLISKCAQEVVASVIQHKDTDDALIQTVIELLKKWACETYEGQRISVAIGIDPNPDPSIISNIHIEDVSGKDFIKVLSNGIDTILALSLSGHVVGHLCLESPGTTSSSVGAALRAPYRYAGLAEWAKAGRVALALNKQGEVLVFQKGQLRFAFRRGAWARFAHESFFERLHGLDSELVKSIYSTCLDVSFARTGCCIAVADSKQRSKVVDFVNESDFLRNGGNNKSRTIRHLVNEKFQDLSRPIRQELSGIDGAVVLDHTGIILAVGAIVKIGSGSEGGGRRAAATTLAQLGIAIKVSADGGITGFRRHSPASSSVEVAFEMFG